MRSALATLVLAVTVASPRAQEPALPALDQAAPLTHPSATRAVRGVSICVQLGAADREPRALRAANYLARLLEASGAQVALVLDEREDARALARSAGAALLIIVSGRGPRFDDRALDALRPASVERDSTGDVPAPDPLVLSVDVGSSSPGGSPELEVRAHREPTHRVLEAVVAWCEPRADALRARARRAPGEPRRPNPLWPLDRPPATDAEAAVVLDNWRARTAVDRSQVYLQIEVRRTDAGWEMGGATELPLLADAARRTLASVGVTPVTGDLRILPDHRALDGPAFGIVVGHAVVSWREPGASTGHRALDPRGQVEETELQPGEPVRLLDLVDGFVLTHALSGYLGWVPEAAVRRCDEQAFGARLRAATLGDREALGMSGELAARAALARVGTPYVFGGRGSHGIDCSGLVETSWAGQGVFLPRDAGQQILAGALTATRSQPAPLVPGDLLFFANGTGRISHVAVSLGGHRFVHATPPEVTVASLDPEDPYYASVAERFVLAKRVAR